MCSQNFLRLRTGCGQCLFLVISFINSISCYIIIINNFKQILFLELISHIYLHILNISIFKLRKFTKILKCYYSNCFYIIKLKKKKQRRRIIKNIVWPSQDFFEETIFLLYCMIIRNVKKTLNKEKNSISHNFTRSKLIILAISL